MQEQQLIPQSQIMVLAPGLYLFRYASNPEPSCKLLATVQCAPVGQGLIDFLAGEGIARQTLSKLGDCIVVRIQRAPAGVLITKYGPPDLDLQSAIKVQIDRIDTSGQFVRNDATPELPITTAKTSTRSLPSVPSSHQSTPTPQSQELWSTTAPPEETVELLGHVEWRGDIRVCNQWLGDPHSQARIEGFAVYWLNRPEQVNLLYTCHVQGYGQIPPVTSGTYMGTRQKRAAITSVSFALTGAMAKQYLLTGEVVFAGQAPLTIHPEQKLSGPSGTEQLVALRIQILRSATAQTDLPPSVSPWDDPKTTRIFRSDI
jgi:hypothetical protein